MMRFADVGSTTLTDSADEVGEFCHGLGVHRWMIGGKVVNPKPSGYVNSLLLKMAQKEIVDNYPARKWWIFHSFLLTFTRG